MKQLLLKLFLYFLFLCISAPAYAQNFHLKINGSNEIESQIIDSLNYPKNHTALKSLFDALKTSSEELSKKGYLSNKIVETKKINDSSFTALIDLKTRTKNIHIYIGTNHDLFKTSKTKNDTVIIRYEDAENFLNEKILDAEKAGFALTKIKFENIQNKNSIMYADLNMKSEKKRTVNSIIINQIDDSKRGYFPKGHTKQLNKKYLFRTFNQEIVKELYNDINTFEFVTQTKYPEILFTNDSTKIYVYLEKRKANTFDGYIGFSNDDNKKTTLNGYLDISLTNTLKVGEQFSLYWKSDGNQQKTFNTKIEIPYIFQSALGLKAQLNIFKQDSTFQNTKTAIDLGYFLNYNSKVYLGYQSTESSDIQNTNNSIISDYKNSFLTTSLEYKKIDQFNTLFSKKTSLYLIAGYGKRTTNSSPETAPTSKQFYANISFSHNFELNNKNFIYINPQSFYLKSNNYISNELFRFGGINSIRGFTESSLQGNNINLLITEYRYLATQNLYLHSIIDYGIYQDQTNLQTSKKFNNLLSAGVGLGLLTKTGILRIIIANGTANTGEVKFYNSILTICYNVKF